MSKIGRDYRQHKLLRRFMRAKLGKPCSACIRILPKSKPSILLPWQRCRAHMPNHRDMRPPLTPEDLDALAAEFALTQEKS